MLVLTRKENEGIVVVGQDVEVIVREIKGSRVVLAIQAPQEVKILRTELLRSGERE